MQNSGLPKSMTSIAIREPGGPDMLVPQQQPVPAPGEGEILVRVAAAGANRPGRVSGFVAPDRGSHAADAQAPHPYRLDATRPRVADKAAIAQAVEKNVLPLLASGRVKPLIDSTFPLAQASAAHARMEGGKHIGIIVLTI